MKAGSLRQRGEQGVLEAGPGDALEVHGRDDLVGVDVALAQRDADAGVGGELFHGDPSAVRSDWSRLVERSTRVGGVDCVTERPGPTGEQRAADRRGRRDERRHQVGAAALALPALEVAVGGRGAALPRRELVRVHAQAHRAAGEAPLGAEVLEDLVEALGLGLEAHPGGAGHDHHAHAVAPSCGPG